MEELYFPVVHPLEIFISTISQERGWIFAGFIWNHPCNLQIRTDNNQNWLDFGTDPNGVKITARLNGWNNFLQQFLFCLSFKDFTYMLRNSRSIFLARYDFCQWSIHMSVCDSKFSSAQNSRMSSSTFVGFILNYHCNQHMNW